MAHPLHKKTIKTNTTRKTSSLLAFQNHQCFFQLEGVLRTASDASGGGSNDSNNVAKLHLYLHSKITSASSN
jgi:hypothetical protein